MKYDLAKLMYKNLSDIKKISSDRIDKVREEYKERSKRLDERKKLYDMSGDSFGPTIYDREELEKIKALMDSGAEGQAVYLSESMGIDPLSKDVEIFDDHLAKIEEDIRSSKNKIKDTGFEAPPVTHWWYKGERHDKNLKHIELILRNRLGVSANVTNLDGSSIGEWHAEVSLKFPFHSASYPGRARLEGEIITIDVSSSSSNMEAWVSLRIPPPGKQMFGKILVTSKSKELNEEYFNKVVAAGGALDHYELFFGKLKKGLDIIEPFILDSGSFTWIGDHQESNGKEIDEAEFYVKLSNLAYPLSGSIDPDDESGSYKSELSSIGKVIGIILSRFNEVISNGTFEDKDEAYELIERGDDLMEEFYINKRKQSEG